MPNKNDKIREERYLESTKHYGDTPPFLFYLLSHHECTSLDHCLRFTFRKSRPLYMCARCFGAYIGFAIGMVILLQQIKFPSPLIEIILYLFGGPALVDWSTQTLGYRVSQNRIRVPTGFLYGIALPIALSEIAYWLTRNLLFIWRPIVAIIAYYVVLGLVYKFRKNP